MPSRRDDPENLVPEPFDAEPFDERDLLADVPAPGQVALVRSRRYLVEDVEPPPDNGVPPGDEDTGARDQTVVHLSCLDDDAQGRPLSVLWESEVDAAVLDGKAAWKHVARRGFDPPEVMSAYLDTLRWHSSTASDPRLFQAPFRAGIEVMTYQLEPLRKALALPRVNLFIADDVGLGKTIEAGLILRELLLRQKVHNVVVAAPPSVLLQWRDELEQRFGLRFVLYDREYVQRQRRERGFSVNAWDTHTRFILSHALLRNETYAGPLRDWLARTSGKSLLILDEAHNFAPATSSGHNSRSRYALDSKQTRALREIAPLFEHRLFLSATPHNGHSNSFSALLEILDPQRFCRGVDVAPRQRDEVLVRRLKSDLRDTVGGIPKRVVEQIDLDGLPDDAPELVLARLLDEYRRLGEERTKDLLKEDRAALGLVASGLQKRLLSSIDAFARTLAVHRRTLEKKIRDGGSAKKAKTKKAETRKLRLLISTPNADDDGADLSEAELEAEVARQLELGTLADTTRPSTAEMDLLDQMRDVAEAARNEPDRRVRYLVDWIRENMCPDLGTEGASWNGRRLLVFTEFVDTKNYLEEQLRTAIAASVSPPGSPQGDRDDARNRIATYTGRGSQLGSQSHEEIRRAFNTHPGEHPLRILIANEAAREGINLQNHCYDLFHFDLPWNPSRIEQRNGRIDRKLQRNDTVYCRYFVFTQRPEDRVLRALVRKTRTIREELGSLATVVEQRLANLLEDVVRRPDIEHLCTSIDDAEAQLPESVRQKVREELEDARRKDLKRNLDELRTIKEKSQEAAAFDEERFRAALSCSLRLLGSPPLEPMETSHDNGKSVQRYRFPALDKRIGADPTWAPTLDTLRAPRPRQLKLWEWRDQFPIRPVVFEDAGSLDADTVHLHLEHPVVQRLLHRFQARGFAEDGLSRAAMLLTRDAQRRIVLLGRLSLYGKGASRLHEEVLAVTARWRDPEIRDKGLEPYAAGTEAKTLQVLEEALTENRAAPEHLQKAVLPHVGADVDDLAPFLEERADQREAEVTELLYQRGEREARDMEKILVQQRKSIEAKAKTYEDGQLSFDFNALEARQLELNRQHWHKRLAEIEEEIVFEPRRIRTSYRVQVSRIEPVGILYLWPASG